MVFHIFGYILHSKVNSALFTFINSGHFDIQIRNQQIEKHKYMCLTDFVIILFRTAS